MSKDDGSDTGSVVETLPQDEITMLLNVQDFQEKVAQDPANLCCVIVTSTLCRHCGIRRVPYPKPPRANANAGEDGAAGDDEDGENGGEEEEGDEEGSQGEGGAAHSTGHFYRDVEQGIVRKASTAAQRRHVRFFHVCACMEAETCVDFLIAADPAYSVLNKEPTAQEIALLHKKSHQQLQELLNLLEVRSTPYLRFYLAGQPLRYSAMTTSGSGASVPKGVTAENDVLQASGANWIKWSQTLQNAVAVRNEVMRSHDAEEREKARAVRAEGRRQARLLRKKGGAGDGDDDDEQEEEGDE